MKVLYKMLNLRKKINAKKLELTSACEISPKAQILTGMPHGGTAQNAADTYLERKEKLCIEIDKLYNELNGLWHEFNNYCRRCKCKDYEIYLLKLHYYYGYEWNRVREKLIEAYSETCWNKNRMFAVRRRVMNKIDPKILTKNSKKY